MSSLRHLGRTAALLAVLATAACSAGDSTGPSTGPGPGTQPPSGAAKILGTYRLATVNGDPTSVPWEADGGFANYFTSGEIQLKDGGRFSRTLRGKTVIPGRDDIVYNKGTSGTYTFDPSAPGEDNGRITLHHSDGSDEDMEITQVTITEVNRIPGINGGEQDIILVYVKD